MAYFSKEQYQKFIEEVRAAEKSKDGTKAFRRLHRFSVVKINGEDTLIVPMKPGEDKMQFYVTVEDIYGILLDAHIVTGHGGRNRMVPEVQKKYKNVSVESIMLFLGMCGVCLAKKKTKKRGLTVKPMIYKNINDRVQVDLIDYQSNPDGPYRFIMNVQDHVTKFVHLRPLKKKKAVEEKVEHVE